MRSSESIRSWHNLLKFEIDGEKSKLLAALCVSAKCVRIAGTPYQYPGNTGGSTLRLSLGCLLSETLNIQLRRVASGNRRTFLMDGERRLSDWMGENAYVVWTTEDEPWRLETLFIDQISLPLNLAGNDRHPFQPILARLPAEAKAGAAVAPICPR